MANLLQSSQNKSTCAPGYYTNYLTTLATKGQQAACQAQYVGAQPLQQEAFCQVATNFGAQQPTFQGALSTLGCAANKNIAGAAQPYLNQALNTNTGQLAQCYMSPYITSAVNQMSDIANRNIQQNLDPMATAGLVGSGQFGSQRGAQVLGQVRANALQCLNNSIANMENTGYNQALNAATQRQSLLNQLASTAGTTTAECARAKQAAGLGMGTVGQEAQAANIACINALSTLGSQQQTIGQNAQCYDLSKYAKMAGLLQGASIPTSVKTTMCMSPLSGIGAVGAGALGLLCKYPCVTKKLKESFGKCMTEAEKAAKAAEAAKSAEDKASKALACKNNPCAPTECQTCVACNSCCACNPTCCCTQLACNCACCIPCCACAVAKKGGLIHGKLGCRSTRHFGGLPARRT